LLVTLSIFPEKDWRQKDRAAWCFQAIEGKKQLGMAGAGNRVAQAQACATDTKSLYVVCH
jgi:hypothetical protein